MIEQYDPNLGISLEKYAPPSDNLIFHKIHNSIEVEFMILEMQDRTSPMKVEPFGLSSYSKSFYQYHDENGSYITPNLDEYYYNIPYCSCINFKHERIFLGLITGIIEVWSLKGDEIIKIEGNHVPITNIDSTPDGEKVISVEKNGVVKIWEVSSGTVLFEYATGFLDKIHTKVSPNGEYLIIHRTSTQYILKGFELDPNFALVQPVIAFRINDGKRLFTKKDLVNTFWVTNQHLFTEELVTDALIAPRLKITKYSLMDGNLMEILEMPALTFRGNYGYSEYSNFYLTIDDEFNLQLFDKESDLQLVKECKIEEYDLQNFLIKCLLPLQEKCILSFDLERVAISLATEKTPKIIEIDITSGKIAKVFVKA